MIFDINLGENFRRKARMIASCHTTKTPSSVTYSSVGTQEFKSVVDSSSKLESTLNKKHNSIAYHLVRWNVEEGFV